MCTFPLVSMGGDIEQGRSEICQQLAASTEIEFTPLFGLSRRMLLLKCENLVLSINVSVQPFINHH